MKVSLEEIRQLRKTLNENRAHHQALLTQARILREHCHEVRMMCRQASREMADLVSHSDLSAELEASTT